MSLAARIARRITAWRTREDGAVAVEVGLLAGLFVVVVGGGVEASLALHTRNEAMQSARLGARLAATQAPVATELTTMTGLGNGALPGDTLAAYDITCSGASRSCTQGAYDASAMSVLVWGPNGSTCRKTASRRVQGMCAFGVTSADNVEVRYRSSGLGRAGNPASPVPIITVRVVGLEHDWVFLESLLGDSSTLDPVEVTTMAENLGRI